MNSSSDLLGKANTATVAEILRNPDRKIAILTHLNPDGDTLGSALALSKLFIKAGHHPQVITPNDYPDFLRWMPGIEQVIVMNRANDRVAELVKSADVIFCIDFNELKRVKQISEVFDVASAYKVLIDHHPDPQVRVDCQLSDTSVSSTAELVYRFIFELAFQHLIDHDIASCLYTGIMTDTGCFSYNSSNRRTWETVAELLDYGIDKDKIYSLIYDNFSTHRMRLLGFSLNEKLEVFPEYKTGIISLSKQDMLRYHFEVGDSEGFVNYPLSISGIHFSALFIEKDDHVKISFRSKGKFAVNEFSRKNFNGGGHKNASGGESYTNLEEAVRHFKHLLPVYKEKLSADED
jgi:phosphoesterase RecJ-like protein